MGLLLAALTALSSACATQQSPLMHATMLLDGAPSARDSLLVFVRDSHPCDGGDPFRIVDDGSRFIGEIIPASKFAVRVTPGHHTFFAWQPHGDLPTDLYPNANQVGVLDGDFEPGKTYTVDVSITNAPHGVRKTCFAYQFLAMHLVDPSSPQVGAALDKAAPYRPDAVAGQTTVNEEHADVAAHIALGTRKLGR